MNIIQVHHHPSKESAARILGLRTYDAALPQQWLDEFVKKVEVDYHLVLSSFVWSYDHCLMGHPYPLTLNAFCWLKKHDVLTGTRYSDEYRDHVYNVLDIAEEQTCE